jgi:hypothetical protein
VCPLAFSKTLSNGTVVLGSLSSTFDALLPVDDEALDLTFLRSFSFSFDLSLSSIK